MKVKFLNGKEEVEMVDGELISRCGGVLACVRFITTDGPFYSVTHTMTGAAIRTSFLSVREAERFGRSFYRQCGAFEKSQLMSQSSWETLKRCFSSDTKRFVQTYRTKK